jgi:membrane fusion protein, heavy metal efflux system
MKRLTLLLAFTASVVLGCPRAKDAPKKQEKTESAEADGGDHEHQGLPKVVHLSPEVFRAANLEVAPAKREILRATLLLPGEIAANPDRSGRISSTVAGRVEEVRFQEGAAVKKGDVVVVLRVPDLGKIRGAFSSATSKAKAARTNADRLKDLSENRLASNQAYLDAEAEAQSLDAEQKALAEQLSAVGAGSTSGSGFLLGLRAPVSGVVVRREAVVGQPVTADQTLGSIADLGEAWFLARVFEKDLGRLRQGESAEVELNAYPTEAFEGTVEVLSQQIDPVARTLTARIGLKNRGGLLRVGLFGAARVDVGDEKANTPVLVVPRSALTQINGKQIVFVRTTPDTFDVHEVVLGESAVGKVRVVAGLQEGEAVVTRGTFTLKSLVLKGSFAEEE